MNEENKICKNYGRHRNKHNFTHSKVCKKFKPQDERLGNIKIKKKEIFGKSKIMLKKLQEFEEVGQANFGSGGIK